MSNSRPFKEENSSESGDSGGMEELAVESSKSVVGLSPAFDEVVDSFEGSVDS